ncbi:hypothetical protein DV737_g2112, partial [Chaetothyriales sp. CBS 132003]
MLAEILLSLSGYQSEIWQQTGEKSGLLNGHQHDYVSEPERAMLEVLKHMSSLHIHIRDAAARLAAAHPSVICRAVCSAIGQVHLAAYRGDVLEIEGAILSNDAAYVGAYGIVPLSAIVSDIQPWRRRLEWLSTTIRHIDRSSSKGTPSTECTGRDLLEWLGREIHTGYSDIEEIGTQLLVTAQKCWLQIAASWLLYGKLSSLGANDFFVCRNSTPSSLTDQFVVESSRIPSFVSKIASDYILVIGTALVHIQSYGNGLQSLDISAVHPGSLLASTLAALESLTFPLNQQLFEACLAGIDKSISQDALSQLLPFKDIALLLSVVNRFMLVADGEFAMSLIDHATERVTEQQGSEITKPVRRSGLPDHLAITDSDLRALLTKTWDELAALRTAADVEDDTVFEAARKMLVLQTAAVGATVPLSTLMPTTCILSLQIRPDSKLALFLTPKDVRTYTSINAYLLSIRRADMQLASLWKLTSHRRCHPTPLGPPRSATPVGQRHLRVRRAKGGMRTRVMREHWAAMSKTHFVISEINGYLHGEVVRHSWDMFNEWLCTGQGAEGPKKEFHWASVSLGKSGPSLPERERSRRRDPRALAQGHHAFLEAMHAALLIADEAFISSLKALLTLIDHYVALFARLKSVWEGLDLEEDDGVVDAFSNLAKDEKDVLREMARSRLRMEEQITGLVNRLKSIEKDVLLDMIEGLGSIDLERQAFRPWMPRTMNHLIMKLDFLNGMIDQQDGRDGTISDD